MFDPEKIILAAERGDKVHVPMGRATQGEVDAARERLRQAALNLTTAPIEILTLPDEDGGIKFLVRRYV